MRESIPKANIVVAGFRLLDKRLGNVRRSINSQAARCMRSGEYDAVQRWMEVGKNVADFANRFVAFGNEWKRLVKATRIAADKKTSATPVKPSSPQKRSTPASRFYEPALRALTARGGEATSDQLAQDLEASVGPELTKSDLEILRRLHIPRWRRTLDSARRDCIREGWIEKQRAGVWKLTEKGRLMITGRRGALGS